MSRFPFYLPLFLLHLIISLPAWAYQSQDFCGDAAHLSLEGAIHMALSENPRIAAAQSQLEASGARITEARSSLLPQLNFSENFSRTNSPTGVFSAKLNQGEFTQQDFDLNIYLLFQRKGNGSYLTLDHRIRIESVQCSRHPAIPNLLR